MPAPFNSPWNITTISDANLNGTTHGNGTTSERTAITNWAANRPFFDTTLKIWYCNTHASAPSSVTWSSISKDFNNFFYGTGVDGSATNPVLTAPFDKNYTDLTINTSNLTMTGTGVGIIRCTGTLIINNVDLILSHTDYVNSGKGAASTGGNSARGGNGGSVAGTLFIFAKTIDGQGATPRITGTGGGGTAGVSTAGSAGDWAGATATSGDKSEPWGAGGLGGTGGQGSSVGNVTGGVGGIGGGDDSNLPALFKALGASVLLLRNSGAGGGGGDGGTASTNDAGGGGGAGAGNVIAKGGNGATGGTSGFGQGGGGGSASPLLVIITDTMDSALTVVLTGGAGGAGSSSGGQGGGGAAGALLIANSDIGTFTMTGGTGANTGSARKIFVSITDFKTYF